MDAVFWEWLNMGVRWLHVIAGIAWIGSSFYFVHLDSSIKPRQGLPDGAGGEAWQVHGGGFYHMVKYLVAPARMPEELTWFKWEAYATWLSGMGLLVILYYFGAELYMIDRGVLDLPVWAAVAISIVTLALGWVGYDQLCKSKLGENDMVLFGALFVALVVLASLFTFIYSGRGAYMQMGALVGTIMVRMSITLTAMPAGMRPRTGSSRQSQPMAHTAARNSAGVSSSTTGWKAGMRSEQPRHRPRRMIHDRTGILSTARMGSPQSSQWLCPPSTSFHGRVS